MHTKRKKHLFIVPLLAVALGASLLSCARLRAEDLSFQIRRDERVRDWCLRLERNGLWSCAELKRLAVTLPQKRYPFLAGPEFGLSRLEGALRPGSYRFSKKESLGEVLTTLLDRSLADYGSKKAHGLSVQEQIILASIVEKEAVSNYAYERIARVFLNRLRKNSPLGSCPTVEYALDYHRPFLLLRDLKTGSPYNVYKFKGLPPTPIAFFSDEALAAVRRPASGTYQDDFFFVYDWTTSRLYFARDYQNHKKNAKRARSNFLRRYGRKFMYKKFPNKYYEDVE